MEKRESKLAKAIQVFCVPRLRRICWGDGRIESDLECQDRSCMMQGKGGKTKEAYQHSLGCPLSLLQTLGDGPELHKRLALKAHDLDYEGGGYSSCPLCKGQTAWNGNAPTHKRNCPGGVAGLHRISGFRTRR